VPRFELPDHARRLDEVLRDLGYVTESDRTDLEQAYRVFLRRSLLYMNEERFRALAKGKGADMTAEEATRLADGLGFDVRRLLYESGMIPTRPDRPQSLLDELDGAGSPW